MFFLYFNTCTPDFAPIMHMSLCYCADNKSQLFGEFSFERIPSSKFNLMRERSIGIGCRYDNNVFP